MRLMLRLKSLMVVLCVLALVPVLLAQSGRGTITGTVTDNTGGVIPGAEITATNIETGVETKTVTTDVGLYRIPYIQPGRYRVAASMSGFKTTVQDNVQVLTTQTVTANFALGGRRPAGSNNSLQFVCPARERHFRDRHGRDGTGSPHLADHGR
jgi:hypothetical protein